MSSIVAFLIRHSVIRANPLTRKTSRRPGLPPLYLSSLSDLWRIYSTILDFHPIHSR